MANVGIFYGSSTGNTELIAGKIKDKIASRWSTEIIDISKASAADLDKYTFLILGTSTWGIGELQDDWALFLDKNKTISLKGKSLAFFGLGDQDAYPDTFLDGMGILYEIFLSGDSRHLGMWPTEGYEFEASRAQKGEKFVGLAIDEDNQGDLTEQRLNIWIRQIIKEY